VRPSNNFQPEGLYPSRWPASLRRVDSFGTSSLRPLSRSTPRPTPCLPLFGLPCNSVWIRALFYGCAFGSVPALWWEDIELSRPLVAASWLHASPRVLQQWLSQPCQRARFQLCPWPGQCVAYKQSAPSFVYVNAQGCNILVLVFMTIPKTVKLSGLPGRTCELPLVSTPDFSRFSVGEVRRLQDSGSCLWWSTALPQNKKRNGPSMVG